MSRFTFALLILSTCFYQGFGQNFPHFSQFPFQGMLYNPAVTGSNDAIEIDALYRSQWSGIQGQPKTLAIAAQSPINRLQSNLGLFFMHDRLGAEKNNYIQFAYAWRTPLKFANLAFGLSGGIVQKQIDGRELRAPEGEYREIFTHNDDYIPENFVSSISGDMNVGVYLNNEKWYAGVAVNNLLGSAHSFTDRGHDINIRSSRYLAVHGGYLIKISKNFDLQPNVLVLSDFNNYQGLYNLTVYFKQKLWLGMAFRGTSVNTKESIIPFLGFKVAKQLKLGYSYDAGISEIRNVNGGSHEIFVKYLIDIRKFMQSGKIIYNPRFM
ncbi:MAG: PorP/SprF family type IX secretion system membrane protein [Chitinophagales bacterium]